MYALKLLIIAFGLLILIMSGLMTVRPEPLRDFLIRHSGETWMHVAAAGVRIVMGFALILYAVNSRFPLTLQVLGWIAVIAGVVLALVPPARFKQLVSWAFERFGSYTRIAGAAAFLFGAFLVYAVI